MSGLCSEKLKHIVISNLYKLNSEGWRGGGYDPLLEDHAVGMVILTLSSSKLKLFLYFIYKDTNVLFYTNK